jgi:uncharacterized protein YkwD
MRLRAALALPVILAALPAAAHAGSFEDSVMAELNKVRAHPQALARELRHDEVAEARYSAGYGPLGQEDPEAVEDAIDFLMRQPPLPPLSWDHRLASSARTHVARQGPTGEIGHGPPGSFGQRMRRAGVWAGLEAETISYGQRTPHEVVRQLVIDSRVPGRGHRRDVFGQSFQAAGVACGAHAQWGSMCVIDFAGSFLKR